jgi:hypothetical protein
MASRQHGSVGQSTWWAMRSMASLVAVLLAAFGLLTLTAPEAQALGTGSACVFIQPQGAKWAVAGPVSGNFGHIAWGYQVAGSATWVFGSTENPNGTRQIDAPGFNGAWKASGTRNDMLNAFNLQSHYPSSSVNPASLSGHPSAPYTRYKCATVANTNVTNANTAAAGNLGAGYTLGTNDCLSAVIRVLQGYNVPPLPPRVGYPTPNTWFDALDPSTWNQTGNLGETWINLNSDMYLDLSGPGTANGTPVHQWSYNGGDNQWWFRSNAIYGNVFTRYGSNKCMGVGGASQAAGAPVVEWDCNGSPDQQWIYIATGGYADGYPIYHIINLNSGQCLGVQGGSTALGSQVVQWPCNGNPDQAWF